jgi:hypothetical protein
MQRKNSSEDVVSQVEKPVRQFGVVSCIRLSRGFGFVLSAQDDDQQRSIFFAFSMCRQGNIPAQGDLVSFVPSTDREGRPIARDVHVERRGAR